MSNTATDPNAYPTIQRLGPGCYSLASYGGTLTCNAIQEWVVLVKYIYGYKDGAPIIHWLPVSTHATAKLANEAVARFKRRDPRMRSPRIMSVGAYELPGY